MANRYKKTLCKYCDSELNSVNFSRHLKRRHGNEREIQNIFGTERSPQEIRQLVTLVRNQGNLDAALQGSIIPKKVKKNENIQNSEFEICKYCNGFYKRSSLTRHLRTCFSKPSDVQGENLISSLIYRMSLSKYCAYISKLSVTEFVFKRMNPDIITETAIGDPLVAQFAERLFQSKKTNRSLYVISNRIRECGRFLIEVKNIIDARDMLAVLKGSNYDACLNTIKVLAKFNAEKRFYGVPSLALHFGTTLMNLASLAKRLIIQGKFPTHAIIPDDQTSRRRLTAEFLEDLEKFYFIVKDQWHGDAGSLALKDLTERKAKKPELLPITEDIMKLKTFLETEAEDAYKKLSGKLTKEAYYRLAEVTLALTIMFNRKRPGDVQYMEKNSYEEQIAHDINTNSKEFQASLSESEKLLTSQYRRLKSIGKGTRDAIILLPKKLQKYYTKICEIRNNQPWFPTQNVFLFVYPNGRNCINGANVIRKYAVKCGAKKPELLTCLRLRKHIATVTQVLNLQKNEVDQLAKFLGHTTKTHEEFYK